MIFISDKDQEGCSNNEVRRKPSDRRCRGSRNKEEKKRLDKIFENDIAQLERTMCSLDLHDRSLAAEWINKLRHSKGSINERIARNDITQHLLKCKNASIFKAEPYNRPPPAQSVADLNRMVYLSPGTPCSVGNNRQNEQHVNDLFKECHDQGSFLSTLPVPRDGSFFIMHMRPNL